MSEEIHSIIFDLNATGEIASISKAAQGLQISNDNMADAIRSLARRPIAMQQQRGSSAHPAIRALMGAAMMRRGPARSRLSKTKLVPDESIRYQPLRADQSIKYQPLRASESIKYRPLGIDQSVRYQPLRPDESIKFRPLRADDRWIADPSRTAAYKPIRPATKPRQREYEKTPIELDNPEVIRSAARMDLKIDHNKRRELPKPKSVITIEEHLKSPNYMEILRDYGPIQ